MNRFISGLLLLSLAFFSSCATNQPSTDAGADAALGVGDETNTAQAQQELNRIQEAQREEQRHQLERQISDPVVQPPASVS